MRKTDGRAEKELPQAAKMGLQDVREGGDAKSEKAMIFCWAVPR